MSAELLREAAAEIRADHGEGFEFMRAVADWLTREADLHDAMTGVGDLLNSAARALGKGELRISFAEDASQMAASTMPQAIAVAAAYLGRQP